VRAAGRERSAATTPQLEPTAAIISASTRTRAEARVVPALAPLDRLSAKNFYERLDWLREDWGKDETYIAKRLVTLRRMFEHLPSRYYERALPLLGVLARARIVNGEPWKAALLELRRLVSEWDNQRPALLECEVCGIEVRGHPAMKNHLMLVHDHWEA
jgi:hypothetical protein